MKRVVLLNDLDMSDIVSNKLYNKYVRLLVADIKRLLKASRLIKISCPGCGKRNNKQTYSRMGMKFNICQNCASHYVNPRPRESLLDKFYIESKACIYWRKNTLKMPKKQLYYIYGPRFIWIEELVDEFVPDAAVMLDINTKYPTLLSQVASESLFKEIRVFNPQLFERSKLLPPGVKAENMLHDEAADVITAFESVERMSEPDKFFEIAARKCKKGGLLLITTACSTGLEYQVLGGDSPNINPINRMNLFSLEAVKEKVENAGFEIIELSTPGRLDCEIIMNVIKKQPEIKIDNFWRYIFEKRSENAIHDLQKFLQVNQLSSHLRIAARKK